MSATPQISRNQNSILQTLGGSLNDRVDLLLYADQ